MMPPTPHRTFESDGAPRPSVAAVVLLASVWTLALIAPGISRAVSPPPNAPETAQEVVDRAIEYHGGELYERSASRLTITSRSGSFQVRSEVQGPRFDHSIISEVDGVERRIRITNDTVEAWQGDEPRPVEGSMEQRLRDQVMARVYFPFLPYRLNDPSVNKEDLGYEEWSGRLLRKVKVSFDTGTSTDADDEYLYWFDPETGRLEQFAYSFYTGQGGLRLRTGFNYRRVGGILFFDSHNFGVDGPELEEGGVDVDRVTPGFVEEHMEKISTVTLSDIDVTPFD